MAIPTANSLGSKIHAEAVQTVVPTKPTDPRQSFKVQIVSNKNNKNILTSPNSTTIFQRRFHIILCHGKARDADSGYLVAGRIKESLGRAMEEEPILAGRLRQQSEDKSGGGGDHLEVISNDSGVRLVEAKADMELADFVELNGGDKKKVEAELMFWEDVVEKNTRFSPLFYVQVTNFTCGGYSVGFSCSLLLVDPFVLSNFLKKFAKTMLSNRTVPQFPTFYLPELAKPNSSPSLLMRSNSSKNAAQSVIFKVPTKINLDSDNINTYKNLAALCIDKAERETGTRMASKLSLFVKGPNCEDATVEICSRQGLLEGQLFGNVNGLTCARTWDELGLESICLDEGERPVYVSCWINSVVDNEGFVMIIPSSDCACSVMRIVVTFT